MPWVAYKQHKFISHSTGSWEVQDQDADRVSVSGACFLVHKWLSSNEFSGVSFMRTLIPFMRACPHVHIIF